jgi:hypothetical protein
MNGMRHNPLPSPVDLSALGFQLPDTALEQGCFTRAVVAKYPNPLALLDRQIQLMQDLQLAVISVDLVDA